MQVSGGSPTDRQLHHRRPFGWSAGAPGGAQGGCQAASVQGKHPRTVSGKALESMSGSLGLQGSARWDTSCGIGAPSGSNTLWGDSCGMDTRWSKSCNGCVGQGAGGADHVAHVHHQLRKQPALSPGVCRPFPRNDACHGQRGCPQGAAAGLEGAGCEPSQGRGSLSSPGCSAAEASEVGRAEPREGSD